MSWNDVVGEARKTEKVPYSKFDAGNTMIRIIDNEPYSFWTHWLEKQKTSATCMGRECPMCAVNAQMKANKEAPKYGNSQRHAVRIWNHDTQQMEIMIQGKTFFSQLLTLHKEVGDITTYDIKVVRKGAGTDTTYTLLPQPPKDLEVPEGAITDVDFENTFSPPTKEEMILLMEGKTWAEINGVNEEDDA